MKREWIILALSLLLAGMPLKAGAEPGLELGSINALIGQTVSLPLRISGGQEPYAGVNAKILLPKDLMITGISKGALLSSDFTTDWRSYSKEEGNEATLIAYSGSQTFTDSDGTVLEIIIKVASDAPLGNMAIRFAISGLSNEDGSLSVPHTTLDGSINCFDPAEDSDDDGLYNYEEIIIYNTDPLNPDSDGDGLMDGIEISIYGTDPLLWDSDGDGMSDGWEVENGSDPLENLKMTIEMNLPSGWSMISLPVETEDKRIAALFPGAGAVFGLTTEYELLNPNDELTIGRGYWIYLPAQHNYTLTGTPIENLTIPNCPCGWSMIGGCSYPANASVEEGRIRAIFGFTNRYNLLRSQNTLEPGRGYWINLSNQTTVTLMKK